MVVVLVAVVVISLLLTFLSMYYILDTVLSIWHVLSHIILPKPYEEDIIIFILLLKKHKLR